MCITSARCRRVRSGALNTVWQSRSKALTSGLFASSASFLEIACREASSRCSVRSQAGDATRIGNGEAKLVIYCTFLEGELEAPKHLARRVHDLYSFLNLRSLPREQRGVSEMHSRLPVKELDPIPQFRATAKLAPFLEGVQVSAA